MKKQILSITIVLALIFGVATFAEATGNPTTSGSITFINGGIIVVPSPGFPDGYPDTCCDCDDPQHPEGYPLCDCPCHNNVYAQDGDDYAKFDFGGNLYFGEWFVGDSGVYDSYDVAQTTAEGTHTGIQVINQTVSTAGISVEISTFNYNDIEGKPELEGAELTLMALEKAIGAGFDVEDVDIKNNVTLIPGTSALVLETPAASRVRASWSGELYVEAGAAKHVGRAQAVLTWTSQSVV